MRDNSYIHRHGSQLIGVVGLLLASSTALAGERIDEHRPLKADGRVHVSNVSGSVEISTWDKNEVSITGELGEGTEKLDISGSESSLDIVVRTPRNSRNVEDTDLRIRVPVAVSLNVETVSANIDVQGLSGKLVSSSVSGDQRLRLASPDVEVHSVSGDIELQSPSKNTSINSVSGDIRADDLSGKLSMETVSGDARVTGGGLFSDLRLKSISGDVQMAAALTRDGHMTGETLSGDLELRLPVNTSATVRVHSFSGEFRSAFSDAPSSGERRDRQEVKLGGGEAKIELSSFSGDVRLERR